LKWRQLRERRFLFCPFKTTAYEENGVTGYRDKDHPVLHGAAVVKNVDVVQDQTAGEIACIKLGLEQHNPVFNFLFRDEREDIFFHWSSIDLFGMGFKYKI